MTPIAGVTGFQPEVICLEQAAELWLIGEQRRCDRDVRIGREFGDGQARRAGVHVDRLCSGDREGIDVVA